MERNEIKWIVKLHEENFLKRAECAFVFLKLSS